MEKRVVFNRKTKKKVLEKVYYEKVINFLYMDNFLSKFLVNIFSKGVLFSRIYGWLHNLKITKYKIKPFIKQFKIDISEFLQKVETFKSFNDFFIRKLKPSARPIDLNENTLILPCDGKFLAFSKIDEINEFDIKGKKFNLDNFLQDKNLVEKYKDGAMLVARLAPQDYHRFHFPMDCTPGVSKLINGYLYSVNPVAIRKNINIFSENKRIITFLKTNNCKNVLYVEIGATAVGSVNQTYFPNSPYKKGEEKGYFSLGGSSIVLLFEKNTIKFDEDLVEMTKNKIETQAYMGETFAKSIL